MLQVAIIGVGMTRFGKHPNSSLKDLAREALVECIKDASIDPRMIQFAAVGNSLGGLLTGQESIRGHVILHDFGLVEIPVINVESACATASAALNTAYMAVSSGKYDIALALGVEKMYVGDTKKTLQALSTATDIEFEGKMGIFFPGVYAMRLKKYMLDYDVTQEEIALAAVKSHNNGYLNPYAQYRKKMTVEEIVNAKTIAYPITQYMMSGIGDGAAAAIICNAKVARKFSSTPIKIASSILQSNSYPDVISQEESFIARAAKLAYEEAGIGPEDVDVVEVHDAAAPGEIIYTEQLGIIPEGKGVQYLKEGRTEIGGDIPVNPSGGLTARGHPIGATGLGQITELVWQLRGDAGNRQISNNPKVALAQNGGGYIGGNTASMAIHILER